jgi:hypothetical protein
VCTARESERVRGRESFRGRWRRGREHDGRCGRKRDARGHPRVQLPASRTKSMRDDETTLPRMTGDAGLLMSITTSESELTPIT